jgi:hypothetical protein
MLESLRPGALRWVGQRLAEGGAAEAVPLGQPEGSCLVRYLPGSAGGDGECGGDTEVVGRPIRVSA